MVAQRLSKQKVTVTDPATRQAHNRYQQRVFKKNVDFFKKSIPEDVQRRTAEIVAAAELEPGDRVLDVGTGIGVLIPHIQRFGVRDIIGCDLSEPMLAEARRRYPEVKFWCGDIVDFPETLGLFDAIFFNAVFGNMWDQRETLKVSAGRLTQSGRIIISHPMGAAFAEKLAAEDPRMVPHPLPSKDRVTELTRDLPLDVQIFRNDTDLYLCVLNKRENLQGS